MPRELPREPALCNLTIQQSGPLIIPDAHADERFSSNVFVLGEPRIRFYASTLLVTPDGHKVGTVCLLDQQPRTFGEAEVEILHDLAAVVMSQMELRLVAMNDSLTGALSRRAFRTQADAAIQAAFRSRTSLALITFDLDHFKQVNDRFGHPMGDKVLVTCVETCRRELRAFDFVGRLGGEEFAVVLPGCAEEDAMEVAERIRMEFTRIVLPVGDEFIPVSASFGVTTLSATDDGLDEMLHRADAALYEAKAAGRNTCRVSFPASAQHRKGVATVDLAGLPR